MMTFKLTVALGSASSSATLNVTVTNVNHAPEAHFDDDQTVNEGSPVALDATASFDPDNPSTPPFVDPLTFSWIQIGDPTVALSGADTATPSFTAPLLAGGLGGPQTLTFRVTVSDGALTSSADVNVVVEQVNHAPTADAGTAQTVHPGRTVTLTGSGSTDADGDPLFFGWTQVSGPAVTFGGSDTATASFVAPPVSGTVDLTFRLTASDTQLSDSKEVTVTVKNGPPVCSVAQATVSRLWPPSHGLIEVGIIGLTDPDDASVQVRITGVTQDEPVNGLGDGDTAPDAVIQTDKILLRAERSGTGNGRVYMVSFTADDGLGGTCSGSVSVTVPHSMKSGVVAIDDGQLHDSTQP